MPGHYAAIVQQLTEDIRTAVADPSAVVVFGRPRRKVDTFPHAVVLTSVARAPGSQFSGPRKRDERYTCRIQLRLGIPDQYLEAGYEPYVMGIAATLTNLIDPYSTGSPPPSRTPYAGVSILTYVESIEPVETEDSDPYLAIDLVASFLTQVSS